MLISPIVAACLLSASSIAQSPPAGGRPAQSRPPQPVRPATQVAPPIRFEPAVVNLGSVVPASRHPVQIVARNVSNAPILIEDSRTSCRCTAITSLAGTVLPPNGTATISATMDAPTVPGEKDAYIYLTVQGYDRAAVAKISVVVRMAVEAVPYYIDIRGGKLSSTVHVRASDGRPFRILSAGGEPPKFVPIGSETEVDPNTPRSEWFLEADFSRTPTDRLMQYWVVETDRDDCATVPVQVRHELTGVRFDEERDVRFWIFGDSLANAGRLRLGESYVGSVDISGHNPRRGETVPPRPDWGEVKSLRATSSLAEVELLGVESHGDKVVVNYRFTPTRDAVGKCIYEPVELRTATGAGRFFVTASVVPAPEPGDGSNAKPGAGTGARPGGDAGAKPGPGIGAKPGGDAGAKPGAGAGADTGAGAGIGPTGGAVP